MRKMKLAMLIVFCVMLFGGTVVSFVLPDREFSDVENRELAKKPKITAKRILSGEYQKEYDTYLSDQFFFRDKWVDLAVREQIALGKKDFNGVYLGKNNYLLEKYEKADFDSGQIKENETYLTTFLNETEKRYGRKHVRAMFVPSKTTALTNALPAYADTIDWQSMIRDLQTKVDEPNLIYDLTKTMQSHNEEYIYYRTDHHWTSLGAYYAYRAWALQTGRKAKDLSDFKRVSVFDDFYGTTYNKIHAGGAADVVEKFESKNPVKTKVVFDDEEKTYSSLYFPNEAKKGFNRYQYFMKKNSFQVEITTKAHTGKTLLLVKDSFANCFVPFLTEHFDKIIMIDYRYGKMAMGNLLSSNSDITDVLVLYNTEKFLQNKKLEKLADIRKVRLPAAGAGDAVVADKGNQIVAGHRLDVYVGAFLLLAPAFHQLVGAVAHFAGLAVDQRVVEGGDVAGSNPHLGVHQDRGVKSHIIGIFLHEFFPPGALDVVLELHPERAVVPGVGQAAVDFRAGINKAAPLGEGDDFFHCFVGVLHHVTSILCITIVVYPVSRRASRERHKKSRHRAELLLFGTPSPAEIRPAARAGETLKLPAGKLDGAVIAPGGGENGGKAPQRLVQPDLNRMGDRKGADPAGGMSHQSGKLLGSEHLCFGMELILEFSIVDFGIPRGDNQHRMSIDKERKGFCNPRFLTANRLRREGHRRA